MRINKGIYIQTSQWENWQGIEIPFFKYCILGQ